MNGSKSIFASVTFWGTVLAVVAPLAAQHGITLDTEGWSNDIASLIGGGIALWGRMRATSMVRWF